jgi:choline monooxygenase
MRVSAGTTHEQAFPGVPADLAASLEAGYTLPGEWYTSASVFQLEKERIFARAWQYAGHLCELREPGDFFTCRVGDVPLVVLRDERGELRAFINVCRHRGSELVLQERGRRKSIQCHYHAWTYGLDGSLRAAPGEKDEPGFCREAFSLLPAQVATWGPLIFVNPDMGAAPLSTLLGELPLLVAGTGLDVSRVTRRIRHRYEIAANWKIVVDNYLECYHCPVAHPSFSDLIDVDDYQVTEYEYFSTQSGAVKESARNGRRSPYTISDGVDQGFYAYLWPNFTINIYPGPGHVSLNLFQPVDVDRTVAVYDYCFADDVSDGEVEEFVAFIDQVQREDIVLCESVQRGMRSGHFRQGKLLLSRESALRHFQKLVYRALHPA